MDPDPSETGPSETDYLIAGGKKKDEAATRGISCFKRRTVIVEPLIILYVVAGLPMMTIKSQFIYKKVAESMGFDSTDNTTSNGTECNANVSDPHYIEKEAVQSATATLDMYLSLVTFIPSFFGLLVYGALGDRFGRRLLLILPCIGSLLEVTLYICIVKFDLSVYFFFLDPLHYIFGNLECILLGAFAYIADTVPPERRSFRMTVVDVVALGNAAVANLFVGYWIKAQGFLYPMVFVAGGRVLALLYGIFLIPETVKRTPPGGSDRSKSSLKDLFAGLRLIYKDNGTGRRLKINLLLLAVTVSSLISAYTVLTLFQMNDPLCWDSVLIGYFSSSAMLVKCLSMLFAAGVLKRWLHDKWLLFISAISTCVQYTFLIFATNVVIMSIAPVFGCVSFLSLPMTRALLSTHVDQNEQASVFSLMACATVFSSLISSIATNKIYAASLLFMKGLVFLVDAAANLTSIGIIGFYIYKVSRGKATTSQNIQE